MTASRKPLASLIDALGHRVTATATREGCLVILTTTPDEGLRDGHPCLNREHAATLREALTAFIDSPESARTP